MEFLKMEFPKVEFLKVSENKISINKLPVVVHASYTFGSDINPCQPLRGVGQNQVIN